MSVFGDRALKEVLKVKEVRGVGADLIGLVSSWEEHQGTGCLSAT